MPVTLPAPSSQTARRTAVVLAGGTARRWGGRDKTAFALAGEPLLAHAVRAVLPLVRAVAVVAPPAHPARRALEPYLTPGVVLWTREEPPGGGPVAGLAAGLTALTTPDPGGMAAADDADPGATGATGDADQDGIVVVLAGDLPFTRTAWPRLLAALAADPAADAALGVDPGGHRQPLLAVYREGPLRARLAAVPVVDQPLRVVTSGLAIIEVPVTAVESLDLDTPEDAAAAERIAASGLPA